MYYRKNGNPIRSSVVENYNYTASAPTKRNSIGFILLALVVLAILAALVWYILSGKSEVSNKEQFGFRFY